MARYRELSKQNPYWLPRKIYRIVLGYCAAYYELKEDYNNHVGLSRGDAGTGASGTGDPTAAQAIQLASVGTHIRRIEDVARAVAPELHPFFLMGLTGVRFTVLEARGIPCGRATFFRKKHEAYYRLAIQLGLRVDDGRQMKR